MTGSLKFVLVRVDKSRGGQWGPDDYDVQDEAGHVVGRMLHPHAPKDRQWFWTIVEGIPPTVYNRGYAATQQAMADFRARWDQTGPN